MTTERNIHPTTTTIPAETAAFAANALQAALTNPNKRARRTAFNKLQRGLRAFDLIPPGDLASIALGLAPDGAIEVVATTYQESTDD